MYCYKVKYWDNGSYSYEEGLVAAATMAEAMVYIELRFGARELEKLKLYSVEDETADEHIMPFSEFDCDFDTFTKEENF